MNDLLLFAIDAIGFVFVFGMCLVVAWLIGDDDTCVVKNREDALP